MMLRHMNLNEHAARIEKATLAVCIVSFSVKWIDLGGCFVDDRRGENDYRGPRRKSIYQGVHGCYY